MPIRTALAALVLATLGAAGCSEGNIAIEQPTGAPLAGAALQGTVVNVGPEGAGSPTAHGSAGIVVRVLGSSTVTSTDSQGAFVLSGLPEGAVTLRFQGADCDAAVEVTGLANGRTVTIRVHVSGSQAAIQG